MATEVEITTAIDTAQSQQGLKGLQKGLKELISLQQKVGKDSVNFTKLQSAINNTEGKIGDLKDSFQTLRGSGIERVNSSLGLFREGLLNADTEKLKIGLQGLGAAMKAIPIFLLLEGARLLFENFDKVRESVNGLINGFGQETREVQRLNKEYEIQTELNKTLLVQLDNEIKLLKAKKAPLEEILAAEEKVYDLKLKTLRLQLEKEKANAREIASNSDVVDSFTALAGFLTKNNQLLEQGTSNRLKNLEESSKKITEINNQISTLETDKEVNKINTLNQLRDQEIKDREERIKRVQEIIDGRNKLELELEQDRIRIENEEREKELAEAIKLIQEEKDFVEALNKSKRETEELNRGLFEQKEREQRRRALDNQLADEKAHQVLTVADKIRNIEENTALELQSTQLTVDQRVAIIKKGEEDILAIRTEAALQNIALAKQYTDVLSEVNNLINQEQNEHLRELEVAKDKEIQKDQQRLDIELKNEKLSETQKVALEHESKNKQIQIENNYQKAALKIKKEQFEKEKTLKLVNIAIDTASALVKTTAQLGGVGAATPVGIAMLAAIAALGITQAAVVASQNFDESGFASKPEIAAPPSFSSAPSSDRPTERTPTTFNPQAQVNGQQGRTQKVVVLESDIRETMEKVDVLESRATFGN